MSDSVTGNPARDQRFTNIDFGNLATSCDGSIRARSIDTCDAVAQNLTVQNLTVNNVLNAPPQPYAAQRALIAPFVINLNAGAPPIGLIGSSISSLFASSSDITIDPTSWTIDVAGDYELTVFVTILSAVPTGTAGQPVYLGFTIPVNVNAGTVDTFSVNESLINVAVSTETFIVPYSFSTFLSLSPGDVVDLSIATALPISPPAQAILNWSVKLQRMGP